jgi:exocyst complex component 6
VTDVQSAESSLDRNKSASLQHNTETHDWLVASTVAAALERGLDRDLHTALVQEVRDNAGRIGQVCQDHADVFLDSVAQVAALGEPASALSEGLKESQKSLKLETVAPMLLAAKQHDEAMQALARAQTLAVLVEACRSVALQLERARKQAAAGRPRAALQAVDEARTQLSRPMEAHYGKNALLRVSGGVGVGVVGSANKSSNNSSKQGTTNNGNKKLNSLEETPFGKRAALILPKIENEVLMSARRGLNRWFLALRSGGDGPKAGRAVLRQCSTSWAVGPGLLGMGGQLPVSYTWRAKTADNLLSRVRQSGKVSRASRQGYWYDRDASKESDRLAVTSPREGIERRAEAIAAAFGWYRCWEPNSDLLIDPNEIFSEMDANIHNLGGIGGSRHGLRGSRHGARGGLGGSRHGSRHGKGRSLGFRATTSSQSQAFQEITSTLGTTNIINLSSSKSSKWNEALSPAIFYENAAGSTEEDNILLSLPESVHPVRRAELAFNLLGRSEEFVQYYEQNRFGEVKIGGDSDKERKSYLSSLTGDDVTVGNDRIFFSKQLPHLCASVVGFSAVEAALELGNFAEEEESDNTAAGKGGGVGATVAPAATLSASRFRESSERYERSLVTELGSLFRSRATKASFVEFVRASSLLAAFRASLRIVHPSSAARRHDKDLFALDTDILVTALKIAQDEQLKATSAIVAEDEKIPLLVTDNFGSKSDSKKNSGVPDPETVGLPFGLASLRQQPQKADLDFQEQSRTSFNRAPMDEAYTFSQSVPIVLRSIHSRAIACAAFALSQQELGQSFPEKKGGSYAAGYVLDCVEECVNVAAVGMKDSDHVVDEGSVEKAVQVMANLTALQHCLPRLFGTLIRGMTHVGLIRSDEIEETIQYAEKILKNADKACDAQIGSTYSLVYEICRNRIDTHINYALENFNWVAKFARDMPNAYCEGLCGYLKSVFASLGPMDEGSRAGLHFSCCGHVSERLVKLFAGRPGDTTTMDDSGLQPIARIDAFGIKNLATDCAELERFADSTGVPGLRDCFDELRVLTTVMLDKELPTLLLPENAPARRRKYPILSLEKVANVLEKYVGTGLGAKLMGGSQPDILFIDKKEVTQLSKIVRTQIH